MECVRSHSQSPCGGLASHVRSTPLFSQPNSYADITRPVDIHQMHLRPADFFTSNPALDVPSNRNEASVLVPCCKGKSVQEDPPSHLQGGASDIDAKNAGAKVDGEANGEDESKPNRRLSRALTGLFKLKGKD